MSEVIKQGTYVEYQFIWDEFINKIKSNQIFDNNMLNTYIFDHCAIAKLNSDQAVIITNHAVTKSILSDKKDDLEAIIQQLTKTTTLLRIYDEKEYHQIQELVNNKQEKTNLLEPISFGSKMNEDYTFDNFVVGDCNKECHAACLACAYSPGKFYNPLFIYGNSGLGKTHLLCSVGNYVLQHQPDKKVCYMNANDFVSAVADSIKDGTIDKFKQQLKTYDVLLMDDIQFLANKEKSHEIFFNCYNELINNNKQIIVVSDRLPNEIKGIEERLISRFRQGLTVGIDSPEFETSKAILKKKLSLNKEFDEDIDDDSLSFLATNFSRDVRELEGALKRLQFMIIQFNPPTPVNLTFTMGCFKGQVVTSEVSGLTAKKIITAVADYYNLTRQQITSKTRTKNVSMARQVSMYLIRTLLDLPYIQIGAEFGGKDHSTVMTSCKNVERALKKDEFFNNSINDLIKQLSPTK